ncbi:MAG: hypothetical protein QOD13_2219 [Thermoleophilaceae bacterium]|nr:hypothetical protein [Thermoleophilaceae bacterium]
MDLYTCTSCDRRYLSISEERVGRCPDCAARLSRVWMPDVPRAEPGSYPAGDNTFASMDDFVRADLSRLTSAELDFGVQWRDGADRSYRAAWVEETGELYVVQAGPTSKGGGHVEVLGATDREGVEAALDGWREQGSITWMRGRARRLPPVPKGRALRRIGAIALGATLLAFSGQAATKPPAASAKPAGHAQTQSQEPPTSSTSG